MSVWPEYPDECPACGGKFKREDDVSGLALAIYDCGLQLKCLPRRDRHYRLERPCPNAFETAVKFRPVREAVAAWYAVYTDPEEHKAGEQSWLDTLQARQRLAEAWRTFQGETNGAIS